MVKPYTFDDVVSALNQIAPYDWRGFWTERLTNHGPGAPLGGVEGSGWKVVYDEIPSEMLTGSASMNRTVPAALAFGLLLNEDGTISDVTEGLPAAKAGIGPGMKLIAVNGRRWMPEVVHAAIKTAQGNVLPIELLVENGQFFQTYSVSYHDGDKNPHLERASGQPDVLDVMLHPLTK